MPLNNLPGILYSKRMLALIQTGIAVFSFLFIISINYLIFFGGWNLIARAILAVAPEVDLRVCQEWKTTVGTDGKPSQTPVHTPIQWLIFLIIGMPFAISSFYCAATALSWALGK